MTPQVPVRTHVPWTIEAAPPELPRKKNAATPATATTTTITLARIAIGSRFLDEDGVVRAGKEGPAEGAEGTLAWAKGTPHDAQKRDEPFTAAPQLAQNI